VVDVHDGQVTLPFAAPMLARALMLTGAASGTAVAVAADVEAALTRVGSMVEVEDVRALTLDHLQERGEDAVRRRLRVRWWLHGERTPLAVAVGGTSGVGKSTVSQAVADILGIDAVISTDLVRAVQRVTLHPDLLPALSQSSFSAEKMFRSNLHGGHLLTAFEQQATVVSKGAVALVRRAVKEGLQLVLNGVHIVPGLVDQPPGLPLFSYLLTVPDLDDHRGRFEARFATSDRPSEQYLSRIMAIRELDAYLVDFSRRAGVPVIESVEFDQTVADLVDAVASDLEKAYAIP
jgi:2-phosphoglycerate kinase